MGNSDPAQAPPSDQNSSFDPLRDRFAKRLSQLGDLKDYSVARGLDIDEEVYSEVNRLSVMNQAREFRQKHVESEGDADSGTQIGETDLNDLDRCILALTRVTYPITIESTPPTNKGAKGGLEDRLPEWVIIVFGLFGLVVAAGGLVASGIGTGGQILLSNSVLAIALGFLGAVVYTFYNILGIIPFVNPAGEKRSAIYVRWVLGIMLGWVCYFVFTQNAFSTLSNALAHNPLTQNPTSPIPPQAPGAASIIPVILPFLAGYSTPLVFGILNKLIASVEMTVGLDDISARKSPRKRAS